MARRWHALLLAAALACGARPSLGADAPISDEDAQSARIHYQAGREYYADGKHAQAFREFVEAHRLSRRPELLFNRGLCLEALHLEADALACYRDYLKEPLALDRVDPEKRAQALEKKLQGQAVPSACITELPVDAPVPPPPKVVPVYKRWWLWTVVGVVAAGAIAGGVTAGVLVSRHDEIPVFPGAR